MRGGRNWGRNNREMEREKKGKGNESADEK